MHRFWFPLVKTWFFDQFVYLFMFAIRITAKIELVTTRASLTSLHYVAKVSLTVVYIIRSTFVNTRCNIDFRHVCRNWIPSMLETLSITRLPKGTGLLQSWTKGSLGNFLLSLLWYVRSHCFFFLSTNPWCWTLPDKKLSTRGFTFWAHGTREEGPSCSHHTHTHTHTSLRQMWKLIDEHADQVTYQIIFYIE